jgi:hypothetical protein
MMGKDGLKRRMFFIFFNLFLPEPCSDPGDKRMAASGRGRESGTVCLFFTLIVRQARIMICKHGGRRTTPGRGGPSGVKTQRLMGSFAARMNPCPFNAVD